MQHVYFVFYMGRSRNSLSSNHQEQAEHSTPETNTDSAKDAMRPMLMRLSFGSSIFRGFRVSVVRCEYSGSYGCHEIYICPATCCTSSALENHTWDTNINRFNRRHHQKLTANCRTVTHWTNLDWRSKTGCAKADLAAQSLTKSSTRTSTHSATEMESTS